jgi:hypothetical protein
MLYLKTIDRERDLSNTRSTLRNIQMQLIMHRATLGNLADYKTKRIGEVKSSTMASSVEDKGVVTTITIAGSIGLIISFFIALFIEYIEEARSRRREDGKVDAA